MSKTERFNILSVQDVEEREAPGWMVENLMPQQALVQMFGKESSGKTFLALDLALRIASGTPWIRGRITNPGRVLYVAGEGTQRLSKRIKAWREKNGKEYSDLENFRMVDRAVLLGDEPSMNGLMKSLVEKTGWTELDLIIFDTQARCTSHLDENSAEDMGKAIASLDWLREELGCSMLLVHHEPYGDNKRGRGSSAMPGALDTAIHVEKRGNHLTLSCTKQKDFEEFESFRVGLAGFDGSAVIIEVEEFDTPAFVEDKLAPKEREVLGTIKKIGAGIGFSAKTLEEEHGHTHGSVERTMSKLKNANALESLGDGMYKLILEVPIRKILPDTSDTTT